MAFEGAGGRAGCSRLGAWCPMAELGTELTLHRRAMSLPGTAAPSSPTEANAALRDCLQVRGVCACVCVRTPVPPDCPLCLPSVTHSPMPGPSRGGSGTASVSTEHWGTSKFVALPVHLPRCGTVIGKWPRPQADRGQGPEKHGMPSPGGTDLFHILSKPWPSETELRFSPLIAPGSLQMWASQMLPSTSRLPARCAKERVTSPALGTSSTFAVRI